MAAPMPGGAMARVLYLCSALDTACDSPDPLGRALQVLALALHACEQCLQSLPGARRDQRAAATLSQVGAELATACSHHSTLHQWFCGLGARLPRSGSAPQQHAATTPDEPAAVDELVAAAVHEHPGSAAAALLKHVQAASLNTAAAGASDRAAPAERDAAQHTRLLVAGAPAAHAVGSCTAPAWLHAASGLSPCDRHGAWMQAAHAIVRSGRLSEPSPATGAPAAATVRHVAALLLAHGRSRQLQGLCETWLRGCAPESRMGGGVWAEITAASCCAHLVTALAVLRHAAEAAAVPGTQISESPRQGEAVRASVAALLRALRAAADAQSPDGAFAGQATGAAAERPLRDRSDISKFHGRLDVARAMTGLLHQAVLADDVCHSEPVHESREPCLAARWLFDPVVRGQLCALLAGCVPSFWSLGGHVRLERTRCLVSAQPWLALFNAALAGAVGGASADASRGGVRGVGGEERGRPNFAAVLLFDLLLASLELHVGLGPAAEDDPERSDCAAPGIHECWQSIGELWWLVREPDRALDSYIMSALALRCNSRDDAGLASVLTVQRFPHSVLYNMCDCIMASDRNFPAAALLQCCQPPDVGAAIKLFDAKTESRACVAARAQDLSFAECVWDIGLLEAMLSATKSSHLDDAVVKPLEDLLSSPFISRHNSDSVKQSFAAQCRIRLLHLLPTLMR